MKEKEIKKLYEEIAVKSATKDDEVSELNYAKVMFELKMRLTPAEYDVITCVYGLGDYDKCHSMREAADELSITRERVRQRIISSGIKLRKYNRLPALFGLFQKPDDPDAIEHLMLTGRTRMYLERCMGITTISGLMYYEGDWSKQRNLGRKAIREIEKKMMLAGWGNFRISS